MLLSHRPALFLLAALMGVAGLVVGAAVLARAMPQTGLAFSSAPGGPVLVTGDSGSVAGDDAPATLVGIVAGTAIVPLSGAADAPRRSERGLNRRTLTVQDRAYAATIGGLVTFAVRDQGGAMSVVQRAVQPRRLGAEFWMAALAGLAGAAVGAWVVAARPRAAAARAVGIAGVGLLLAALPLAVLTNAELIVGGRRWHALVVANWTAAQVYGAGLIACFLNFPTPLGTAAFRRIAYWLLAASVVLVLVPTALLFANLDYVTAWVAADFALIAAGVAVQWRRACRDPAARAALRLIGGVTVITLAGFLLLYIPGSWRGGQPILPDAASFAAVLPPFLAITIAIRSGNFLGLDRWAGRLFAVSAALLLLIGVDAALMLGVGMAAGSAASVALLTAGAVWIVGRQALFQRLSGRVGPPPEHLYASAGTVALATTPAGRFERWCAALDKHFAPLSIVPLEGGIGGARLEDGGASLLVSAPAFGSALRLHSARRGTSLYQPHDVITVQTFARLCAQVEADREAYDRGTQAERRRIARDLHDDVSGRLLTSLHRHDAHDVRTDVRAALHELRTLVSDLEHGDRSVEEVVAAVRAETSERLAGAGITLTVTEQQISAQPLHAAGGRAIESSAREAVTNILRHAGAGYVDMTFSGADRHLTVTLIDDGRGLGNAERAAGHGLANMAARMASVGGSAAIATRPEGGTQAHLTLPLSVASEEREE